MWRKRLLIVEVGECRWQSIRTWGEDVRVGKTLCTMCNECALCVHPSCNGAGTHHYQILCYVSNVPRKSELVFELAIEQWAAFTEGNYSIFIVQNVVFFFSRMQHHWKNVWGRFSPGVVGVQETQEKNCYGHLAEVGLTNTRAEKICRLYRVKHDNALSKQIKTRKSTLLWIDMKCNEIFHYA